MLNLVTICCCLFVGLRRLAQALPHASQLTYLDVSACNIGDDGVSDLADAISYPFHGIADKAMLDEEFHGAAPTPAHLQVLKLRDNQISDHGVKELGEAMQQSSSLQDLDLAGNQVSDHQATAKSQPSHIPLAQCNTVQILCCTTNPNSGDGCIFA
jgi:Ran GTPase-activating protein (RanGAP) involved in mRNA processing and transport